MEPAATPEVREKIGAKSKAKFTAEYKEKHRKLMESNGYWIPRTLKTGYELYYKEADWAESMVGHLSSADRIRFDEFGFWNVFSNKQGLVRDHVLSRFSGYKLYVPPQILRHPCNCQLLTHAENVRKGHKDKKVSFEEIAVELELLLKKILSYRGDWKEHTDCLNILENWNDRLHNFGHTFWPCTLP